MFKDKYVGEYDQQDLYDDLRRRTQGKGEKVETFLLNFKYIVSRFKVPPSEDEQVDLAYRNLLPDYRRAMSDNNNNNNNNNNIIFIWFAQKVITCKCYILRYNATQNHSSSNYNYITVNYLLTGRSVVCCFASKISQNSVMESQFACLYLVELDDVSRFILL